MASTYDHSLETQFNTGCVASRLARYSATRQIGAVIISTLIASLIGRGPVTLNFEKKEDGFTLTSLMYLAIISANCGARFVCKGSLTPEASCNTQIPDLEVFTETISSNGSVSRIIKSPFVVRLINRRP